VRLDIYVEAPRRAAVEAALTGLPGLRLLGAEPCAEADWAAAWREGLAPIRVSPGLVVRPSFAAPAESGAELVIDPGQAFGTGGHESTRLALEAIAALPVGRVAGAHVLDVGTGSGILALAALRLGAARAIGIDLDPVAVRVARENAVANGLGERLGLAAATPAALRPGLRFGLVLANLLRRELEPWTAHLAGLLAGDGTLLLSGLLATERPQVEAAFAAHGVPVAGAWQRHDADGTAWLGLSLRRR